MWFSTTAQLRPDCRAEEVKEHPFFKGVDWTQVYLQKYPPPLIPPRGEVNAADAFDIGSFDEEDTKGIKVRASSCRFGSFSFEWLSDCTGWSLLYVGSSVP